MGKTALFYHSGGSSGYESMLRDSSENTGSTSSAQDSLSEHSSVTTSSRRSSKSSKKSRSNTGHSDALKLFSKTLLYKRMYFYLNFMQSGFSLRAKMHRNRSHVLWRAKL